MTDRRLRRRLADLLAFAGVTAVALRLFHVIAWDWFFVLMLFWLPLCVWEREVREDAWGPGDAPEPPKLPPDP